MKDIITQLVENGTVTGKPYLGISVSDVTEEDAQRYNLPQGAYVDAVTTGSPAASAGLKAGDIITAVGDTQVTSSSELVSAKNQYKAGDTAALTVTRGGQTLTLSITFGEEASSASTSSNNSSNSQQLPQAQQGQQGTGSYGSGSFPFGWGN